MTTAAANSALAPAGLDVRSNGAVVGYWALVYGLTIKPGDKTNNEHLALY